MRLRSCILVLMLFAVFAAGCTDENISDPISSYNLYAPNGDEIGHIKLSSAQDGDLVENIRASAKGFELEHTLTFNGWKAETLKVFNRIKRKAWLEFPAKPVIVHHLRKGLSEKQRGHSLADIDSPDNDTTQLIAIVDENSLFDNSIGASLLLTETIHNLLASGEEFTALNLNDGREIHCNASFHGDVAITTPEGETLTGKRCFFYTAMTAHNIVFAPDSEGNHKIVAMDGLAGSLRATAEGYEVQLLPPMKDIPDDITENPTTFKTTDGLTLAGAITLPRDREVKGGVVIVAGSGPVDRNGDAGALSTSPYRQIAHFLARHGYASIRYDKRGVGESEPDEYEMGTFELLRSDAVQAARHLADIPKMRQKPLVVAGHSEGGSIAPDMAKLKLIDGVIMLAGNVSNLEQILKQQLLLILKAAGAKPNEITRFQLQQGLSLSLVKSGADRVLPMATGSLDPQWLRSHFEYDAKAAIRQMSVPLLALYFENDLQIPPSEAQVLRDLASDIKGDRITVREFKELDHMMSVAETPLGLGQYRNPHRRVSSLLLQYIVKWLDENVSE